MKTDPNISTRYRSPLVNLSPFFPPPVTIIYVRVTSFSHPHLSITWNSYHVFPNCLLTPRRLYSSKPPLPCALLIPSFFVPFFVTFSSHRSPIYGPLHSIFVFLCCMVSPSGRESGISLYPHRISQLCFTTVRSSTDTAKVFFHLWFS